MDSDEFKNKVAYAEQNIALANLIATWNVIKLDYSGEKPMRICMSLSNLETFVVENEASDADEDEQYDEAEEEDQQPPRSSAPKVYFKF